MKEKKELSEEELTKVTGGNEKLTNESEKKEIFSENSGKPKEGMKYDSKTEELLTDNKVREEMLKIEIKLDYKPKEEP